MANHGGTRVSCKQLIFIEIVMLVAFFVSPMLKFRKPYHPAVIGDPHFDPPVCNKYVANITVAHAKNQKDISLADLEQVTCVTHMRCSVYVA